MGPWIRLLRPHQWTKNLLLFAPLLAAHRVTEPELLVRATLAAVLFSLLASGLYVFNDVLDLKHDRSHPTKRDRPLASRRIGVASAAMLGTVLVVAAGAGMVLLMPRNFAVTGLVYAVLALGYSISLKRVVLLDAIVLAALYTIRVVAGAVAVDVHLSRWFLAFSVFVFLSLALVKRTVELRTLAASDGDVAHPPGRGWRAEDLAVLNGLGAGSAVAGALVYCLYITSPDALPLYDNHDILWLALPLMLYWLGRVWILTARDQIGEDPVLFALRDGTSWAVGMLFALVVWLAS